MKHDNITCHVVLFPIIIIKKLKKKKKKTETIRDRFNNTMHAA